MSDEAVPPGERVLTSGGDRIFPKGLPIGTVTRVSPGSELFLNIRVKPSANLGKLEEVLVVTKIDERQAAAEQSVPVRAADILAERLPTVPPKAPDASGAPPSTAPPSGTKPVPGPSIPGNGGKPAVKTPATDATATPSLKPKSLTPAAANGPSPGPPKPAVKMTAPGAATADGTSPAKLPQKAAKPAAEPEPQPPAQDNPQ